MQPGSRVTATCCTCTRRISKQLQAGWWCHDHTASSKEWNNNFKTVPCCLCTRWTSGRGSTTFEIAGYLYFYNDKGSSRTEFHSSLNHLSVMDGSLINKQYVFSKLIYKFGSNRRRLQNIVIVSEQEKDICTQKHPSLSCNFLKPNTFCKSLQAEKHPATCPT